MMLLIQSIILLVHDSNESYTADTSLLSTNRRLSLHTGTDADETEDTLICGVLLMLLHSIVVFQIKTLGQRGRFIQV